MLEKTNSVYVIGTLVEVKKYQTGTFNKDGRDVPYVSATIIVKCDINGQENLIQLENFTSSLKKDGTANKNYNTILNIKDLLNERVVISGASLAGNRFWSPRTEQLVAATKINFNLINKATSVQTEDKAEFKFGGFVLRELAEKLDAEGNLEYYTITIAQANYSENDMMEVQFTLPKDNIAAVNAIQARYEQGTTVLINGVCQTIVTTHSTTEETMFGEAQTRVSVRSDKKFIIVGGKEPIVGEGEYTVEAIKALNAAYVKSGEKIKQDSLGSNSKAESAPEQQKAPSKKSALAGLI